jgi:N-acetylglucosaminyldiphosphoundecaprenol N-acetyl-beta-D-mannosaminyltransferase
VVKVPEILGVRIDPVSTDEALEQLKRMIEARRSAAVHLCNAWNTVLASRDPAYRDVLRNGDLNLPDGMSMVWACRMLGFGEARERVAGMHLMTEALRTGVPHGTRHFLYGGGPGVAEGLAERLRETMPGVRIVGAVMPPFHPLEPAEERALAEQIMASGADLVWVGLGTPKQDLFIERFRTQVQVGALLAVGAAFDFLSGRKATAPRWMQRAGLEWAFRLGSEPRRLWRRYLVGNASFVLRLSGQLVRERRVPVGGRSSATRPAVARPDVVRVIDLTDEAAPRELWERPSEGSTERPALSGPPPRPVPAPSAEMAGQRSRNG